MSFFLYFLLLLLQQGNCDETTKNKNTTSSIEETCERMTELCTYTLPRLEKETNVTDCQDEKVRESKYYFVANSVAVVVVGTSTNIFNLVAFTYVYFSYPDKFPWMSNRKPLLLLHLSFCDLLYCSIGVPPFVSIFVNGFFYGSSSLCTFTAGLRNLIAYADIFTMAAVALMTCLGFICSTDSTFLRATNTPRATMVSCGLIWVFSFLIISPAVFEFSIGNLGFGSFGWDSAMGICEVTSCRNPTGLASGAVIYLVGVTIPFLVLLLSHLSLEVFFIWKKKYTQKNQTMVVVLSLAYAIFTFPLFPVELGVQIDVFWYLVFYSWYWWMYAVNVFIYMITDQGFRDVYQLFLKDVTGCFNG